MSANKKQKTQSGQTGNEYGFLLTETVFYILGRECIGSKGPEGM